MYYHYLYQFHYIFHVLCNKDHVSGGGWLGTNPPVTSTPPVSSAYKTVTGITQIGNLTYILAYSDGTTQVRNIVIGYNPSGLSSETYAKQQLPKVGDQVKK